MLAALPGVVVPTMLAKTLVPAVRLSVLVVALLPDPVPDAGVLTVEAERRLPLVPYKISSEIDL